MYYVGLDEGAKIVLFSDVALINELSM